MAETYPYEILIRGKAGGGLDIKGCHLIECTVVNGKDYPGDPVPIHLADLDGLLPEWFTGLAAQIADTQTFLEVAVKTATEAQQALGDKTEEAEHMAAHLADQTRQIAALVAAKAALDERLAAQVAANAVLAATNVALEDRLAKQQAGT